MQPAYPDISDLLAARAKRRQELAALAWEAKVAIIEQMRQSLPRDAWKSRPADSAHVRDPRAVYTIAPDE